VKSADKSTSSRNLEALAGALLLARASPEEPPYNGGAYSASGALSALVTNTSATETGGIVYKLLPAVRLTVQVSGDMLDISWPTAGGRLQAQTNSPDVGISTNWVTVPGSTSTNRIVVPIDPSNGSVFYRLALP